MSLDKINDDLVEQLPPSAIKHFFEKLLVRIFNAYRYGEDDC